MLDKRSIVERELGQNGLTEIGNNQHNRSVDNQHSTKDIANAIGESIYENAYSPKWGKGGHNDHLKTIPKRVSGLAEIAEPQKI